MPDALPALWHSRAGIVASGTATVEAAMMNTPFVMVYRVSSLTYLLGKPRVKVPGFAMVNLIAEEEVVPELVQHDFTADNVVARLKEILPMVRLGSGCWTGLARVKERLRAPGLTLRLYSTRRTAPPKSSSRCFLNARLMKARPGCYSEERKRRGTCCLPARANSRFPASLEITK